MITRQQYMAMNHADRAAGMAALRAYYGQLVNDRTMAHVVQLIGADELRASTDEHLNDIPLKLWDKATSGLPLAVKFTDLGDHASLNGLVCVAKEAARLWLESE